MKILVVDDELSILEALRDVLLAEGHDVRTAANGLEALDRVREVTPDLILLDLMLPKLDGRAVMERLKADAALERIPVILMSAGSPKAEDRQGATSFLAKPFEIDHLLAHLDSAMRHRA